MIQKDKIATVIITLSIAVAIGHFMQKEAAAAARIDPEQTGAASVFRMPLAPAVMADTSGLALENQTAPLIYAAAVTSLADFPTLTDAPSAGFVSECGVAFEATPTDNAMVRLSFAAACNPNVPVTVHHDGLQFTQQTDHSGMFEIVVPALSKSASYQAELPNGTTRIAETDVFTADGFVRVALVWDGSPDLYLHAFENGATFDEPGHIWANTPSVPDDLSTGERGFLVSYGTGDALATRTQVYSHAIDWTGNGEKVEIMIEAEVSDATCGKPLTGALVQSDGLTVSEPVGFSVQMPDCDAVGGFIQLKNMVKGLTLSQS